MATEFRSGKRMDSAGAAWTFAGTRGIPRFRKCRKGHKEEQASIVFRARNCWQPTGLRLTIPTLRGTSRSLGQKLKIRKDLKPKCMKGSLAAFAYHRTRIR